MKTFQTIAQAIAEVGTIAPDRGYLFQDAKGAETLRTFPQLEVLTAHRAAALQSYGLQKGDRMGLVVVEPEDFVLTFFAALRIGVLPVPMYPPLSLGSLDAYAERSARILELSGAKALVISAQLANVLWSLKDSVSTLERVVKVEDVAGYRGTPRYPEIGPDDLAFLQYTSGSTSDPKGVMVTHGNLVANCSAIAQGLALDGSIDKGVSWLPLYHDMGLIGCTITPLLAAVPMVFIPTMRFIKKPSVWLDAMHVHKGTITFAPNFAYALAAKKAKPEELARWDLSHVKGLGCGAEPIHPETAREFMAIFAQCGIPESAFLPAYGMAEATLAMTFKPLEANWSTRLVHAASFQEIGRVQEPVDGEAVLEHVSCGTTFPGHEMRVRGESGEWLPDGVEGELCLRGPSVTPGYWQNPEATAATIVDGGWLRTGDLGYVLDGHVYVTGRLKDLIILNGRNIHPQAIEWVVATVEGVRKGNVVAFSRPGAHSEELVVALETRAADKVALEAAIKGAVQRELSLVVADVVCLDVGALPKTSSGKLQRRKTRQQYLAGGIGAEGSRTPGSAAARITLARHVAKSVWSRAKSAVIG